MTEKLKKRYRVADEFAEFDQLHELILINDDENTFEFVIETLIDICFHNTQQAEQCAMITHYNGKCQIKKGSFAEMKLMRRSLVNRGLNVIVN